MCYFIRGLRPHTASLVSSQQLVFLAIVIAVSHAHAHEGHKPLPAKGVEVDIERGSVLLTKSARDALGVQLVDVAFESGEDRVLAYAKLVSPWQQRAYVGSQVPGRIVALHINPGDPVTAGQVLAEIESSELHNLQLELINAQNAFRLSSQMVEHFGSIDEGIVAGSKLQEAAAAHRDNINAVENAQIKLLNLGLPADRIKKLKIEGESQLVSALQILSPISGIAYHSDLSIGKVVITTDHLFKVVDLSSVWGKIEILERDIHRVEVGQEVEVSLPAYPNETFRGKIQVKEIYLDPETHLGTAWIDLENPTDRPPRLLPGMFGQAQVIIATPEKLLTIPATALARDGAERFVLALEEATDKASQYAKRNVVVVRQDNGKVQFRADNVFPGDRVVTVGAHELFNFFVQGVLRLSPEASANIGLRIEQVSKQIVGAGFAIDGLIEFPATGRDKVSSQLSGVVETVRVTRGQQVHKGDVICELASFEFQDLQLQLINAQNDIANLETTLKRWESLRDTSAIPKRQRWETESLLLTKQNLKENLKRKLAAVGMSDEQIASLVTDRQFLRTLPLRATIDGYIVHFDRVIGEVVDAGETILEVHDPSHARIRGFVSERELTQVRIGQSARVRFVAFPDLVAEAVVTRSGQGLDTANRSLTVWLDFGEMPDIVLQHDMMVRLNMLESTGPPTLAVSPASIVDQASSQYVFVKSEDEKFERRLVTTGRADDRFVEVTSGLKAGETIAAWGVSEIQSAYASLR